MGYFSNLAMGYTRDERDHSYTPAEQQLLWRLEELQDRYDELLTRKRGMVGEGAYIAESDLRYVLPEHIASPSDVQRAIELTVRDLQERYGLSPEGVCVEEESADNTAWMQISFLDVFAARVA